jgi:hypothetical protein
MANRPTHQQATDTLFSAGLQLAEFAPLVAGKNPDGSNFFLPEPVAEWTLTATADNAVAAVTRPAEAGRRHYVTGISGSYSAALAGLMRLLAGVAVIGSFHAHNQRDIELAAPIELPENTAVTLDLAASGTLGQIGAVVLRGYTI